MKIYNNALCSNVNAECRKVVSKPIYKLDHFYYYY